MDIFSQPKNKTWRNKKYLEFVRSLPCSKCGRNDSCAHHIIGIGNHGGTGMKAPDYMTMPLCAKCHHLLHHSGLYDGQYEYILSTIGMAFDRGIINIKR